MPSTVVISAILPYDADGSWCILGTVDGNTNVMRWDKPFNPTELTPAAVAQAFLDAYARMDQLVVQKIASRTINVTLARSTTAVAVVFGNKAACYEQAYDQAIFVATVGGVTYYCTARERDLVEAAYAGKDVGADIAKKIAQSYVRGGSWLGSFIASFSLTSTTSSSTTTTTTTSTTTTTTTTTTSTTTTTHT